MLKIKFVVVLFLLTFSSFSQKSNLIGVVFNEEKQPIQNSVIALLREKDSVLIGFHRSNNEGKFDIKNIKTGKYILMTSHNKYADYVDEVSIVEGQNDWGTVVLLNKSKLIEEVLIKSKTASIRIKGDTTSYKASDFKVSENANAEELLKKLPGIQVDKNGNIKAMGESVKKVLVDGEEFFGDDP